MDAHIHCSDIFRHVTSPFIHYQCVDRCFKVLYKLNCNSHMEIGILQCCIGTQFIGKLFFGHSSQKYGIPACHKMFIISVLESWIIIFQAPDDCIRDNKLNDIFHLYLCKQVYASQFHYTTKVFAILSITTPNNC